MHEQKQPATCRFRKMPDGILRIHDLERNFFHEIYPFVMKDRDQENVSLVIKSFSSKLGKRDLFKLAKRLEELNQNGHQNWEATYQFMYNLYPD